MRHEIAARSEVPNKARRPAGGASRAQPLIPYDDAAAPRRAAVRRRAQRAADPHEDRDVLHHDLARRRAAPDRARARARRGPARGALGPAAHRADGGVRPHGAPRVGAPLVQLPRALARRGAARRLGRGRAAARREEDAVRPAALGAALPGHDDRDAGAAARRRPRRRAAQPARDVARDDQVRLVLLVGGAHGQLCARAGALARALHERGEHRHLLVVLGHPGGHDGRAAHAARRALPRARRRRRRARPLGRAVLPLRDGRRLGRLRRRRPARPRPRRARPAGRLDGRRRRRARRAGLRAGARAGRVSEF